MKSYPRATILNLKDLKNLENLVGISAVAILIAGTITTIVVAARKVVRVGAKGVSSQAKSLANADKKLRPVAVLYLISKLLTLCAKGIIFSSNNLWILAVLFASYIVYNKRRRVS